MTSPKHAFDKDGWGRYYQHPTTGQQLVSVTNALSVGMSKYGLPLWYAGHSTEAAWDAVPRMVAAMRVTDCATTGPGACGRCRPCLTRDIKAAAERARDKAADLGTRVHDLAEVHVTGRAVAEQEGDDIAGLFVGQYLQFLTDYAVDLDTDVEAAELSVAHPALGYAGTLDLLVRLRLDGFIPGQSVKPIPDGEPRAFWLLDIKTSMTRASTQCYPENALQLTALKNATEMWLPDDTVTPMLRGIKGCAVLNLRRKTYKLIPLPTGKAEFAAFRSVLALCQWLHADWPGEYEYRPVKPDGKFQPKQSRKSTTSKAA